MTWKYFPFNKLNKLYIIYNNNVSHIVKLCAQIEIPKGRASVRRLLKSDESHSE